MACYLWRRQAPGCPKRFRIGVLGSLHLQYQGLGTHPHRRQSDPCRSCYPQSLSSLSTGSSVAYSIDAPLCEPQAWTRYSATSSSIPQGPSYHRTDPWERSFHIQDHPIDICSLTLQCLYTFPSWGAFSKHLASHQPCSPPPISTKAIISDWRIPYSYLPPTFEVSL